MIIFKLLGPMRPLLIAALLVSIPAFYLSLATTIPLMPDAGRWLYAVMSLLMLIEFALRVRSGERTLAYWRRSGLDISIFLGALASCAPSSIPWSGPEWVLRLLLSALIFARIVLSFAQWEPPNRLLRMMFVAAVLWGVAGAGFYWMEAKVDTFADGLWLVFTTGATVGYGDLVPSTHASRIFAVFIVLLGYAIFSFITASISALFIGDDERQLTRELHKEILKMKSPVEQEASKLRDQDRNT
jgi:voltage-gated potassium channel